MACDLHPDYLSTRYARETTDLPVVEVQHHHAHIAACMAENKADGPVIGLAFDGTGLGTDGTIWGGEVLVADYRGFTRAAHLQAVPMPGSATAIREPWRMALAHLMATVDDGSDIADLPVSRFADAQQIQIIRQMIEKNINSPMTSSLGRLCSTPWRPWSACVDRWPSKARPPWNWRPWPITRKPALTTFPGTKPTRAPSASPAAPLIRAVTKDLRDGRSPAIISARFHNTLVALFDALCSQLRNRTGIDQVALSGGVFQNDRLLSGLCTALAKSGFQVLTHRLVPANDGGISLGQAVIAATTTKR